MTVPTAVADDIEILLADGSTWLPLSLVETYDRDGNVEHPTLSTQLAALVADLPLGQRLHSQMWTNRGGGIGIDYNAAYGLYTRTPGIVTPAGAATQVTIPAGNNSASAIRAIEEFGTDLFMAQLGVGSAANSARVISSASGTGAFADSLTLGIGEFMYDLCLFSNGAGTRYLYASSGNANGLNGRLHRWNGAVWASTAAFTFGTNGRSRLWRTFWQDRGGVSYPRLVAISGANRISYTIPGGDPFLAASWVEGVEIDTAKTLLSLGGTRRHVFMGAGDNLFDLNEYGESPPLTSYWQQMPQTGNAEALQYLNGYLYASLGTGLDRVYVDSETPLLQEAIGQCAPGWGTKAENDVRGYVTAMCPDQGYLVASVFNPTAVRASFVCWGLPKAQRPDIRDDSANPLLWYGPEVRSDRAAEYVTTRMRTSALSGDLRLWVASQIVTVNTPDLIWISLPVAGVPLQDLISAGSMRFANGSTGSTAWQKETRLELLPTPWNGATQIVDQSVVLTRGLSQVRQADGSITNDGTDTKLIQRFIADPPPGAISWPAGDDVTVTPSQTVNPSATKKGERIWQRIDFISPNGAATPPKIGVLDACRVDAWLVAPTAVALPTLTVQYGAGVRSLSNTEFADRDPEWVTAQLKTLTSSGRTIIKLRDAGRYTVKFEQVLETNVEYTNGDRYSGKVVTTRLSGLLLAGPL